MNSLTIKQLMRKRVLMNLMNEVVEALIAKRLASNGSSLADRTLLEMERIDALEDQAFRQGAIV